jgi:hypothetical protein
MKSIQRAKRLISIALISTSLGVSVEAVATPAPVSTLPQILGDVFTGLIQLATLPKRPVGEGSVLTQLPASPGYPEGVVVVGDKIYVSGPAAFGTAGTGPSAVTIIDRQTGAIKGKITIQGEDVTQEHALSCITSDAFGRLYVLSTQLGVVRLTPKSNGTYKQDIYAGPFPDLPAKGPGVTGPSSPTAFDGPPLVNDLVFDYEGNLYVTDSMQATIYRIAPGGGTPKVWFQSPRLEGPAFNIGLNGIRLAPDGRSLALSLTFTPDFSAGRIFKLALKNKPTENDLTLVHEFAPTDAPDGIAYDILGRLYVALALSNQVAILDADGSERSRISGPFGSPLAFDGPANIAFDQRGSILVTNHASISNQTSSFALLKVYARDLGWPLSQPLLH